MPVALGESVYTPVAPQNPPRVPWTREEVRACERAGLWEGRLYELVNEELITKMGKNSPHVRCPPGPTPPGTNLRMGEGSFGGANRCRSGG